MTQVTLADGTLYTVPTGAPGTWPWAREASLIAVAYKQANDFANAYQWEVEFSRRAAAVNAIAAGSDSEAILAAGSWMDGPAAIVAFLGKTVSDLENRADQLVGAGVNVVNWVPVAVLGLLVVIALGFGKKQLRLIL